MVQARVWQIPVLPVVFYTATQRWDSVGRLLDLMERIMAFVYHVREPSEWPSLQETIEASVQTDEHRQEIFEMRRTIADMLKDEGRIEKSQQTFIRQLQRRFGDVPDELLSTIGATNDPQQLDEWLDQVVTAETLDEVGIEVLA